ncbi:hypothetical protein CEXT_570281 [Caerostris extrusa]|uniref:C2H2-type domain-containing protein n=1 Tax=Caerostris extrusa TaxID=172846 RepID=A0AAV4W9J8_CAEEX|nr:hypothetical protein CEXT_570281 [Caerostris extrusa]
MISRFSSTCTSIPNQMCTAFTLRAVVGFGAWKFTLGSNNDPLIFEEEECTPAPIRSKGLIYAWYLNQRFADSSNLRRHMDIHTGRASHKCTECGKCFSRNSTLHEHVRAFHSGENPNKCTECGKYFANPSSLRRHIRSIHSAKNLINVWNVVNAFLTFPRCVNTSTPFTVVGIRINVRNAANSLLTLLHCADGMTEMYGMWRMLCSPF